MKLSLKLLVACTALWWLVACSNSSTNSTPPPDPEPPKTTCSGPDELVTIPDENLEQAIRDTLSKTSGDLSCKDMEDLTKLEARGQGITNLSGLEYAIKLVRLDVRDNEVSDITPILDLTTLEDLALNRNPITSISGLSTLTNLEHLSLESLDLNNADLAELEPLTELRYLGLEDNEISDLSVISKLTKLNHLELQRNQLADISLLASLTNLEQLNIGNHDLNDISVVAKFPKLTHLRAKRNNLDDADMAVLADKAIEVLDLGWNSVTDLSFISAFPNLRKLYIDGNVIADLSLLYGLTGLSEVGISSANISDLSFLADFSKLEWLSAADNGVSDISPLSGLSQLADVDLSENLITDISPLVENSGIGIGDKIELRDNLLDLSEGSDDLANIRTLLGRGVELEYEPQNDPNQVQERCEDWDKFRVDPYLYHNNVWGKGDVSDYEQCLMRRLIDNTFQYGWRWNWPFRKEGQKTRPEIIYGMDPSWDLTDRTTPKVPVVYRDIEALSLSYDVSMTSEGEQALRIRSCLTRDNPPSSETIVHCIYVFPVNKLHNVSELPDTVIGNTTYKLFTDEADENGRVNIAFFPQNIDGTNLTLDIKALIDYLIAEGRTAPGFADTYFTGLEFGNDIQAGTGTTWVNKYEVELQVKD